MWPSLDEIDARPGGNRFYIDGFVDAQNGFGTLLRLDFSCRITVQDDGSFGEVTANVSGD